MYKIRTEWDFFQGMAFSRLAQYSEIDEYNLLYP